MEKRQFVVITAGTNSAAGFLLKLECQGVKDAPSHCRLGELQWDSSREITSNHQMVLKIV